MIEETFCYLQSRWYCTDPKLPIDKRENTKAWLPKPIKFKAKHVFHQGKPSASFFVHLFHVKKNKLKIPSDSARTAAAAATEEFHLLGLLLWSVSQSASPFITTDTFLWRPLFFLLQGMTIGCAIVWPAKKVVGMSFFRRTHKVSDLESLLSSSTAGLPYPP